VSYGLSHDVISVLEFLHFQALQYYASYFPFFVEFEIKAKCVDRCASRNYLVRPNYASAPLQYFSHPITQTAKKLKAF